MNMLREMRKLGLEVRLEPCRLDIGYVEPIGRAGGISGQAKGSTQKIVLTALGGNHPIRKGVTRGRRCGQQLCDLDRLGAENVAGKIVLFDVAFDKQKADTAMPVKLTRKPLSTEPWGRKGRRTGAVGSLVEVCRRRTYRLPHTEGARPPIPAGAVPARRRPDRSSHVSRESGGCTRHPDFRKPRKKSHL